MQFAETARLQHALTHRSAASENSLGSNERLEFVGDSVVGLVICQLLYENYPEHSEGDLAKARAYIVSEPSLAEAAEALSLYDYIQMSPGESATGGRRRRSILSDAFEAVMAAVYLDCGLEAARGIILRLLSPGVAEIIADVHKRDYKSSLQEITQARYRVAPLYLIVEEKGSEHDKTFLAHAVLNDEIIGQGQGKSKKEAEQAAALDALDRGIAEEGERDQGAASNAPTASSLPHEDVIT